jgi:L-aminopeptidase/D-esterase-like protein
MTKTTVTLAIAASLAIACSRPAPSETPAAGAQPAATEAPRDAASAPAPPATPPPPPAPTFREVTVPAGTPLSVELVSRVASNTSKVEDAVSGTLSKPVVVSEATAIPAGATISGTVVEAQESGRIKGRASLALQFNRIVVRDETHQIRTSRVRVEAAQDKKQDVRRGGIGAGVGAVVGGIAGGGSGAAIGAAVGGTSAVLGTKGNEIELAAGTTVNMTLEEPMTVKVPLK